VVLEGFIGAMLRDTVSWEQKTGETSWEGPTYGAPRQIPSFRVALTRQVAGPAGLEQVSFWQIAVEEEVRIGDKLDGDIVEGVQTIRGLDTDTLGYIATTE
jgi:hypothetical protein